MIFTESERAYLASQRLGRLATIDPDGTPQIRPVGFRLNDDDTIDIGGPNLPSTRKYQNLVANPKVGFVVDDVEPKAPDAIKPGWGRGVEIRGNTELVTVDVPPVAPKHFSHEVIRIRPHRVISWHIDRERPDGEARNV